MFIVYVSKFKFGHKNLTPIFESSFEGDNLKFIPEIVSRIMNLVQSNGVYIELCPKFIILQKIGERISNTLLHFKYLFLRKVNETKQNKTKQNNEIFCIGI